MSLSVPDGKITVECLDAEMMWVDVTEKKMMFSAVGTSDTALSVRVDTKGFTSKTLCPRVFFEFDGNKLTIGPDEETVKACEEADD